MISLGGLVLFPGAGSSADHPIMVALEEALAPLPVGRFDFPYRKEGRSFPDRAPKLIATVNDETNAFAEGHSIAPESLVLGGRSMGGRMASIAVAEGLPAAGLVLISYPLHPPGKPERLRIEHFPALEVPCLFISGTRDQFGTPEEFQREVKAIPGPVEFAWVDGARHDIKGRDAEITAAVANWIADLAD